MAIMQSRPVDAGNTEFAAISRLEFPHLYFQTWRRGEGMAKSAAARSAVAAVAGMPQLPRPAAVAEPMRLSFVGDRADYWRLMIRGNALQAVTLGLYRFWLFSDMRRFLWAGIELDDENFEYVGTAGELLIGFLAALGILIPVNLVLFYAVLEMGALDRASILLVVLFAFGQYAAFRARGYRLTRTVLRGLRFRQTGSGIVFALRALAWWIVVLVTLGLAFPFMEASQERYKMRHTYFGDLGGRFEGSGWRLLVRGIFLWFLVIAPLIYALDRVRQTIDWSVVLNLLASRSLGSIISVFEQVDRLSNVQSTVVAALMWSAFFAVVLFPAFAAIVMRWWLDGVRLGGAAVASHLRMRSFYSAYVRCLWQVLIFSIAFYAIATIAAGMLIAALSGVIDFSVTATLRDAVLAAIVIAAYVVYALGCSTIYQVVVRLRIWQVVVESAVLSGHAALDDVQARPAYSSAVGEGLADILGTGGV